MRILLVEDDFHDQQYILDMLTSVPGFDAEVDWCASYDSAIEAIRTKLFDVCLVDYQLKDKQERTGLDFIQQAMQEEYNVPMILVTQHGDRELDLKAMQMGVMDYMEKRELMPTTLERALRYAVERYRVIRGLESVYRQVSDLEQMKTDMLRIAAHDLRNPLAAIQLRVDILRRIQQLTPRAVEGIQIISDATKRMRRIIDDILGMEKEDQIAQTEKVRVDFISLVEEAWQMYRPQAEAHAHRLSLSVPNTRHYIEGNVPRLRRVIGNFVTNAIKYTEEGGQIQMVVRNGNDKVSLKVIDNGYGIPEDQQDKIFQPFYRAESEETEHQEGVGLGLYLAKRIIAQHQGQLIFESVYGEGSTFGFELPCLKENNTA